MFRSQFVTRFGLSCLLSTSAAALALGAAAPAWAQSAPAQHSFDIPALPLNEALRLFMQQSGIQVSYASGDGANVHTSTVKGNLAPAAALSQLLTGTGLTYRFTAPTSAILEPAPTADAGTVQLGPVRVEGENSGGLGYQAPPQAVIGNLPPAAPGGQVATGGQVGILGNRGVMDTPFSTTSYTAKLIEDQQALSLAAVLANDPSVRVPWPSGSYTETLTMRGFPVSSLSYAVNGLYGVVPSAGGAGGGVIIPTELFERVEVLRGPSAMLNGMPPGGSIGGSINLVTKRATDAPITRLTGQYLSDDQFGGQVDFGRRFGAGHEWGLRLNGSYRDGDTSVDKHSQRDGLIGLGLDYRGSSFRASADLGYIDQRTGAPERPVQVATGVTIPRAPDASESRNQSWEYWKAHSEFATARAEYDLTYDWTIYAAGAVNSYRWDSLNGFLQLAALGPNDPVGKARATVRRLPGKGDSNSEEVGLRGRFDTGFVHHQIAFTASRFDADYGNVSANVTSFASNLYTPVFITEPSSIGTSKTPKTSETGLTSFGVADTLSVLNDRIQLTLGVRRQKVRNDNFSATDGTLTSAYNKSATTFAAAFLAKPLEHISLYANYAEGLTQGPVAPFTAANAGETFAPYKSKQYEVGAKAELGSITTTLSAFQIQQPNALTDPDTNIYDLAGEQRNRGLELTTSGIVVPGVRLLGGVSYTEGKQVRAVDPVNQDKVAIGVPKWQINIGGEWEPGLVPGLVLSARILHTSSQFVDAANTQSIPAWTTLDAGARYTHDIAGKRVTFRLNVENVFDKNYWASSQNSLSIGLPRTLSLSAAVDF